MIRNSKLKNFLVRDIFPVFSLINKWIPKKDNYILIYCSNEMLKDNDKALYDYLVEHEFYRKYRIICGVEHHRNYQFPESKNVRFIPKQLGILAYMICGHVFYSFGKIPIKPAGGQSVLYLTHGIPLKKALTFTGDEFFSYMTITSEFYKEKVAQDYGCPRDKICICGEPKTDKLFLHNDKKEGKKLIVWAPTFRQSDYLGYNDSEMESFLPFLKEDEWESFNAYLYSKNVKVIAKLHSAQNLNGFTEAVYSNFEIYGDETFRQRGMELYTLLGESDALIADYSSVYLEYLLLNRPIGFALADYEEYKKTRGFILGDQIRYMPGKKIYCLEDLYAYIDDVVKERDEFVEERAQTAELFHCFRDGRSTERLLEISGISI